MPAAENERNLPERESPQARQLRLTGSLVHRIFEHLSRSELPDDAAQYCDSRQGAWRAQLLAEGVAIQQLESCLATAREAVGNALNTALGRWVLDSQHQNSQAEVELLSKTTNGIRRHIIDRLFYDKGTLWIIDYKTARPEPAESTTAFIHRLKEEYRTQLERYHSLFPETRPIQCAIYNPLLAEKEALILY